MKRQDVKSSLIMLIVFLLIFVALLSVICPLRADTKPKQVHYGAFTWTQVEKKNKDGNSGSELKPCPFCDGKASYTDNFYGNGTGHCVFCEDCGASTAILTGATPPEELKAMTHRDWNRRANNES